MMAGPGVAGSLDYPWEIAPAPGQVVEVAPGVLWMRHPLPFALNHINLWLLRGEAGWTIVDTGIATDQSRALWDETFERHLDGLPVERVVVTHFHPDHVGLADWLIARSGAELCMTQGEWLYSRMLHLDRSDAINQSFIQFYRESGLAGELLATMTRRGNAYPRGVPGMPARYRRIRHDQTLNLGGRSWRVIGGGGHSPEHAALYCAELSVLISGDQVLPAISPNVSVWPSEPDADPLADFFDALERLRGLPEETLVLPSHGMPFRGLNLRIDQLLAHHDERLAETLTHCAHAPRTGAELTALLFPRALDPHQMGFALGEAIAHARRLVTLGRLRIETGADGVRRYRLA